MAIERKSGDQKIAKDWDKEHKSGKANASPININNSTISGRGIGTIEREIFTSVSPKKRVQKETNPRKRANNATAQRIKKIRAIASQHNPPYEVLSFSSDFTTPPTNANIDVAKTIDSIPVTEDDRPEDATVNDARNITSDESESPTAEKAEKLLTDRKVLREKWCQNWAKCDASMTEREANIFECVQLVTRNFFLNISSLSSTSNNVMDEDTFVHRYCHLMLEEIFNMTNYKLFWANGESSSSKERRRSDGCQVELFGMDLAFDRLYHFKKVGRALLPTEDANFLNIVSVISNFYSLLEKTDRSIEELNRPSTPTGQLYHRESNSSPHKVHIPVLKISPPALSD
ncbi:hypothetical protein F8M41_021610 [Gigaspora margarita]|uniref:Uncharacterized protein n=1 Tax=Gigaspora margarita TaxID=4874 RepID=A0A8H4EIR3_GIGMA|nr:hypothetical protein F8M41_021610 [Gigaspora margarita]